MIKFKKVGFVTQFFKHFFVTVKLLNVYLFHFVRKIFKNVRKTSRVTADFLIYGRILESFPKIIREKFRHFGHFF